MERSSTSEDFIAVKIPIPFSQWVKISHHFLVKVVDIRLQNRNPGGEIDTVQVWQLLQSKADIRQSHCHYYHYFPLWAVYNIANCCAENPSKIPCRERPSVKSSMHQQFLRCALSTALHSNATLLFPK